MNGKPYLMRKPFLKCVLVDSKSNGFQAQLAGEKINYLVTKMTEGFAKRKRWLNTG